MLEATLVVVDFHSAAHVALAQVEACPDDCVWRRGRDAALERDRAALGGRVAEHLSAWRR